MPRSLIHQFMQIRGTETYNAAVASANTSGVAESTTNTLEDDLNILRTLLIDTKGTTNWYDDPTLTVEGISTKQFIQRYHDAAFDGVTLTSGTSTNSTVMDTALKALDTSMTWTNGAGNSTTSGVIVNSTRATRIHLRDEDGNAIDDGNGNEVYAALSWNSTNYVLNFFSDVSGVQTAYTFTSDTDVDFAYVPISAEYHELNWDSFLDFGFHDVAGISGTINDEDVVTNNPAFSGLLNGLSTQEACNEQIDKLGTNNNAEGGSLVGLETTAFTGLLNTYGDVQQAFVQVDRLGLISNGDGASLVALYDTGFTDLLSGISDAQTAFEKIDDLGSTTVAEGGDLIGYDNPTIWSTETAATVGDAIDEIKTILSSTSTSEGASVIGIEDLAGNFTATTVEAALAELFTATEDTSEKEVLEIAATVSSGTPVTIPNSAEYTLASGVNMDVFVNGMLNYEGAANDYQEVDGGSGTGTTVTFNYDVKKDSIITFIIRK